MPGTVSKSKQLHTISEQHFQEVKTTPYNCEQATEENLRRLCNTTVKTQSSGCVQIAQHKDTVRPMELKYVAGTIVTAQTSDGPALLCLLGDVHAEDQFVQAALMHKKVTLATQHDAIVTSETTGLEETAVIQAGIEGPLAVGAVEEVLGCIDKVTLQAVADMEMDVAGVKVGQPLSDSQDVRLEFKNLEVERLHSICRQGIDAVLR